MLIESIIGIIGTIFDRVVPDKNAEQKQAFLMEVQQELNKTDLMKLQLGVNAAEASAPNRSWLTWRELLGYVIVIAVGWQYVAAPIVTYISILLGHGPVAAPQFEMLDIMYLLMGMLGIDSAGFLTAKAKAKMNAPR
jgi:hypothetical protein